MPLSPLPTRASTLFAMLVDIHLSFFLNNFLKFITICIFIFGIIRFLMVRRYGVNSWESKIVVSGKAPIEFRVTGIILFLYIYLDYFTCSLRILLKIFIFIGTHFKPSTLTNQITAFFPTWYTTMTVVTTISTYTF